MYTIAIISQKGGAGKTTLAVHLATASSHLKKNTAIIDLDPQASAANWSDRRQADIPVVISAHASRLKHEIARVKEAECEILLLDTAPHSDSTALEAIKVADLVLIPCRPAILDMEAIANSINLVRSNKTPFFVVMNATAPQGHEAMEAAEAIQETINALDATLGDRVCPVHIVNRVAFSRSPITGETAQEYEPNGKAAQEIERVHTFMYEQLNKITGEQRGKITDVEQVCESA